MRINWGKTVGAVVAIGLTGALAFGAIAAVNAAQVPDDEPAAAVTLDYGAEYDRAAAVDAAIANRDARVAEAARAAAEQAAAVAAEAERVAAEQQAVGQPGDTSEEEPAGDPAPWVPSEDPDNRNGGDWDTSGCASGRFESGPDGTPICLG